MTRSLLVLVSLVSVCAIGSAQGQQPAAERPCSKGALDPTCAKIGTPAVPLPDGPIVLDTAEQPRIRVVVITKALSRPWSVAFLPDGSMLITELPGRLRVIRDGKLDPQPVAGVPAVRAGGLAGLMDVALHPRFAENRLLYLTYSKPGDQRQYTIALARARFDGKSLLDLRDIYVVEPMHTGASRVAFDKDGMLYMLSLIHI